VNGGLEQYRILVIDDHPLFRKGVLQLIAFDPQLTPAGEASSGEEGITLALREKPDLTLLDLNMKGVNGIDTLKALRAAGMEGRVVMLTVSDQSEDLVAAIRAGADGYLLKDMEPEDLLANIQAALFGRMVISERLAARLAEAMREEARAVVRGTDTLTGRELAILRCLAAGLSNKLIGRELNITEGTVKVHVKSLLRKLNSAHASKRQSGRTSGGCGAGNTAIFRRGWCGARPCPSPRYDIDRSACRIIAATAERETLPGRMLAGSSRHPDGFPAIRGRQIPAVRNPDISVHGCCLPSCPDTWRTPPAAPQRYPLHAVQ